MKNLVKLGKALNKAEQKSIIGGGGNKLTRNDEGGGGGPGGASSNPQDPSCETDADCTNMPHWANNGDPECYEGDFSCGHYTNTAQGSCTQVSASGDKICVA